MEMATGGLKISINKCTPEKSMRILSNLLVAAATLVLASSASYAIDLAGAWATDAAVCDKVFSKKGKSISFKGDSDAYGSGFVIEGDVIRGKIAKCRIKTRREDGNTTHLLAACSTDISLANVHFAFKAVDDNKIVRLYPGLQDMEVPYSRCIYKQ